jgi:hypothetical protein
MERFCGPGCCMLVEVMGNAIGRLRTAIDTILPLHRTSNALVSLNYNFSMPCEGLYKS